MSEFIVRPRDFKMNEDFIVRPFPKAICVKFKKLENYPEEFYTSGLPEYETTGSSGFDIRADSTYYIHPNGTRLIKTGFSVAVPEGYELQIRSRSGLALKKSVFVLNGIGTVDSDYRSEIGVILHNSGEEGFTIEKGDRIAQGVIVPIIKSNFQVIDELETTERNGGFGSTGVR